MWLHVPVSPACGGWSHKYCWSLLAASLAPRSVRDLSESYDPGRGRTGHLTSFFGFCMYTQACIPVLQCACVHYPYILQTHMYTQTPKKKTCKKLLACSPSALRWGSPIKGSRPGLPSQVHVSEQLQVKQLLSLWCKHLAGFTSASKSLWSYDSLFAEEVIVSKIRFCNCSHSRSEGGVCFPWRPAPGSPVAQAGSSQRKNLFVSATWFCSRGRPSYF